MRLSRVRSGSGPAVPSPASTGSLGVLAVPPSRSWFVDRSAFAAGLRSLSGPENGFGWEESDFDAVAVEMGFLFDALPVSALWRAVHVSVGRVAGSVPVRYRLAAASLELCAAADARSLAVSLAGPAPVSSFRSGASRFFRAGLVDADGAAATLYVSPVAPGVFLVARFAEPSPVEFAVHERLLGSVAFRRSR